MESSVPRVAIAEVQAFEPVRLSSYLDGEGVWRIGWGHAGPDILPGVQWSREQADQALALDLAAIAAELRDLLAQKVTLGLNQFGALVAFIYQIGVQNFAGSQVFTLVAQGDFSAVPAVMRQWRQWRDPHTRRLVLSTRLTHLREAEIALWQAADDENAFFSP